MRKMMIAAAVAATMTAAPALAQKQEGLVNVNVSNLLNNNDVDVRVREVLSRLNTNVIAQVPVGLAANVCGISVLAARNLTGPCDARTDITQGQAQALANANKGGGQ